MLGASSQHIMYSIVHAREKAIAVRRDIELAEEETRKKQKLEAEEKEAEAKRKRKTTQNELRERLLSKYNDDLIRALVFNRKKVFVSTYYEDIEDAKHVVLECIQMAKENGTPLHTVEYHPGEEYIPSLCVLSFHLIV
jgi:hypothetical protein